MKKSNFITTKNTEKYLDFIYSNDLDYLLTKFETGYRDGESFLDIEGDSEIIEHITRLSMKPKRGKYVRTKEIREKNSKSNKK